MFLEYDDSNKMVIKEIVDDSCSRLANKYGSDSFSILEPDSNKVVRTGIKDVDIEIGGMCPSDIVLLASKTPDERNIVAVNIIAHVMKWEKVPTIIFSAGRKKEILTSLLAIDSRVSLRDIIEGRVGFGNFEDLQTAGYKLNDYPLIIFDDNQSLQEIIKKTKGYRTDKFKPRLIVLDNVSVDELMIADGHDMLVKKLKNLAKEMGCIFLILSELPDNDEKQYDRKTGIRDLGSKSALFAYIDLMFIAYCKGLLGKDFFCLGKGIIEIMIPKNREGTSGKSVKQRIDMDTFRFEDTKLVLDLPFISGNDDNDDDDYECIGDGRVFGWERHERSEESDETDDAEIGKELSSSLAKLDELIGLEEVKAQVKEIAAFARMKRDLRNKNTIPLMLNMAFLGNPGTCKTTVARIMAGFFHEVGLLKSGKILEVSRAELISRYVGATSEIIKDIFNKADGRVLFIDEAHSLIDSSDGGDFTGEAISTIVQMMENRRDRVIVICAGYPELMEVFLKSNPGLRSRLPFKISFRDYTPDELERITKLEAKKRGFTIDPRTLTGLAEKYGKLCGVPDLGNGRCARNIAEKAILHYAARVYGEYGSGEKDFMLREEDFAPAFMAHQPRESITFGFR